MTLDELLIALTQEDTPSELLSKARSAFNALNIPFVKPAIGSVKDIHSGSKGKHTGIYFIFEKVKEPEQGFIYYYVGIATGNNTIRNRFQPHYAKLTVNLKSMYGNVERERKETRWQFPKNWRTGVHKHFLNNKDPIPDYWIGKQKKDIIKPTNLDYTPEFKVNVDMLPVLIWNLDHLDAKSIDNLETELVRIFHPVFNGAKQKK